MAPGPKCTPLEDIGMPDDPPPRRCCAKFCLFVRKDPRETGSLVQARKDPCAEELDLECQGAVCLPPLVAKEALHALATVVRKDDCEETKAESALATAAAMKVVPSSAERDEVSEASAVEEEFFSCDEAAFVEALAPRAPSRSLTCTPPASPLRQDVVLRDEREPSFALTNIPERTARPKVPAVNKNRISHYRWLTELLQSIVEGAASEFAREHQSAAMPLFVVAGACPNKVCGLATGMQAVMFSAVEGGGVDFWWIKPKKDSSDCLETNFLTLHNRGDFKNNPGKSKAIYAPLAEKFSGGADGDFIFGVDGSGRAFIEEAREDGFRERLLPYLVWQEAWSGLFDSKKFIRGKIFYQKAQTRGQQSSSSSEPLFAREYEIRDGQLSLAAQHDEEASPALLPPDAFQEMYATFG